MILTVGLWMFLVFFFPMLCCGCQSRVVVVVVVVVVVMADGRGGCGRCFGCFFFYNGVYYFIVGNILFYYDVYITLLC